MEYELREELPTPETFVRLREAAGMSARSRDGVERGLPNSLYAVTVVATGAKEDEDADGGEEVVGMGRIVGDGGSVYHVCDMAVHPDHQGRGLGSRMMDALMAWLGETAPAGAYVNLIADIDGFYERWGFETVRPASKGMSCRVE